MSTSVIFIVVHVAKMIIICQSEQKRRRGEAERERERVKVSSTYGIHFAVQQATFFKFLVVVT